MHNCLWLREPKIAIVVCRIELWIVSRFRVSVCRQYVHKYDEMKRYCQSLTVDNEYMLTPRSYLLYTSDSIYCRKVNSNQYLIVILFKVVLFLNITHNLQCFKLYNMRLVVTMSYCKLMQCLCEVDYVW